MEWVYFTGSIIFLAATWTYIKFSSRGHHW